MSNERWAYSLDGERYHGDYPTREAAIEGGCGDERAEGYIWAGRRGPDVTASAFVPDMVETLAEMGSCSDHADALDEWPDAGKEASEELQAAVCEVVERWADRHGLQPKVFCITEDKGGEE